MDQPTLSRKDLLTSAAALGAALLLPTAAFAQEKKEGLTIEQLRTAQTLIGLSFSDEELKEILPDVKDWLASYASLRALPITYRIEPPNVFMPLSFRTAKGKPGISVRTSSVIVKPPRTDEDMAFLSVVELGHLVKSKQVSPIQLTELYLGRLERYGDKLLNVVTLMPDQARVDAKNAAAEIDRGKYRGPLHGIPTGVKDLFATKAVPTTWGAEPYKDQVFDYDATVVERLRDAGAILCAKLSMGALAQGDVWFKGRTKNPWNPAEGSSGSSAGSASCVAAGLLPYAIGTETLGSIMSPSHQCRVTGLRPTYGRISRNGAMAVTWSMDKIGPIARTAEDCAVIFAALTGYDPRDRSSVDRPFRYRPDVDIKKLKIAFLMAPNEDPKAGKWRENEAVRILERMGASISPLAITPADDSLFSVLEVEAGAAFDDLTRSERIKLLKNSSWPRSYRASRFVPGIEYLQAQRGRSLLMSRFEQELGDVDLLVADGRGGHSLFITNLTGHPQILLPFGTDASGKSRSVSLIGRIYEEATILAVANAIQRQTDYHRRRPDLSKA